MSAARPTASRAVDPFGNPVSVADPAALAALADCVEGFLACEARVLRVLDVAEHDHSALVQAYAAMLQMFAETPGAPDAARPYAERARAATSGTGRTSAALASGGSGGGGPGATERESRFVAAVSAWVGGDVATALKLHAEQARLEPRDLVSVKLGQYHAFNLGDVNTMLRLALPAREAAADVPWVHGLAAFGYEQCHRLDEAEQCARHAIGMLRKEPWAHHALAHVMLTQHRDDEGHAFLREMSPLWTGLNSFMVTHNWWHLALFSIERGDLAEALALYDEQIWGVCKEYSQDQIGAVSLLARIELAGGDVGERWHELAPWLVGRVHDQVQPFLDMQYLYGLARADRPEADTMMASIEAFARRVPSALHAAWAEVCAPACRGLLAHARRRHREAAQALDPVIGRMQEIGGSHAQRALFEAIYTDAALRGAALALGPGMQRRVQSP